VGFSIPKKKFRKAVQRNRIRRMLREVWRLNKQELYAGIPADKQIHLFIIFTDIAEPAYEALLQPVIKGMEKLKKAVAAHE
jgi:ribonuclease P protein component